MKRRTFLKSTLFTPLCLEKLLAKYGESETNFDYLEVGGNYKEIGFQIGKYFAYNIHELIKRRAEWHKKLLTILETETGQNISQKLLEITKKNFPHFLQEIQGLADGASVNFNHIWAIAIKSELGAVEKEPPGCSTIFYKGQNNSWLFHNEDGNSAYTDLIFVVKVKPPSGVNFISFVYPGTLMGNGPSLNSNGIIQTTNYISSTKTKIGIPRYVLGRAILESKNIDEAVSFATKTPRTYPYHHNLACINEKKYYSVETTPQTSEVFEPDGTYFHTNHLIQHKTKNYKFQNYEYIASSSASRFTVIAEELKSLSLQETNVQDYYKTLSSHQKAPYSPCRHPEGDVLGQTLGFAFFDIQKGIFRLYSGNPCRSVKANNYREYLF